jgi:acetoin utilization deacetylase AcuC-like enzyme
MKIFDTPKHDEDYFDALDQALAAIREFNPAYLVVSAGFDSLAEDPSGGFALTATGIAETGRRIAGLDIPTVIVQEGGYLLEQLEEAAVSFLRPFSSVIL